ncbi:MAG TPA: glycosyltransferase family 9 protein [Gemmatimonadaceae bacterium]|jgi:ADP-heptose:LPS heptosyltransferase|nr:glycosyltransferase family 9 protein [Gemmatimonadaceae bacterium]
MPPGSPLPRRILVIQLRRLGDVVLTTALLDDIANAFPDAAVDFLVGPAAAPLLAGHPLIRERIVFDSARRKAMTREIRSRRYDWVVDLQGSLPTAMLARASRARVRIGWRVRGWRLWYTHAKSRKGPIEYVVRERRRLLELAGLAVGDSLPSLHLSAEERELGERDARSCGAPPDAPRVGILLSTREPAKDWKLDGFVDVARALVAEGVTPVIFQIAGDEERAERIRAFAPGAVLVPPLELRRFLGVLATASVFVSGDTGPAHMADALGVPRVTIFGPTPSAAWCPGLSTTVPVQGPGARIVRMRDRASMLAQGHDFTGGVTPDMVLAPVRRLLGERSRNGTCCHAESKVEPYDEP